MKKLLFVISCVSLSACGTPEPLMTQQSTAATQAAINACVANQARGQSLSQLTARGFTQSGNRYVARIDNPKMAIGGSIVRARMGSGQSCIVTSEPVLSGELPTVQRMVQNAVASSGGRVDASVQYNQGGAVVRVTFN